MTGQIVFAPLIAWPILAALGLLALLACIAALVSRARGTLLRLAGFLLLFSVLAGPRWTLNTATPLPDIALVLVDHSASMNLANRAAMAANALSALRASAGNTQLDIVDIPPADTGGTTLLPALREAEANIQPSQLAGIAIITDGEIADATALPRNPPISALLTAKAEETDRELRLINAPSFGLVGQNQPLKLEVIDHGVEDSGATAALTVSEDGTPIATQTIAIGQPVSIPLPIRHAGPAVITAAIAPLPGEISQINNQAAFILTGIHKRLNVLLISGTPDPGERAWRVLLKSDPAVQLVHFTILRSPGEPIDAAPEDIALVPFPVRELFETEIGKFDLIILDGLNATDLLPADYLANIARYVQNGGALLTEVGPEFSGPDSLALSPLSTVLPAIPASPARSRNVLRLPSPISARATPSPPRSLARRCRPGTVWKPPVQNRATFC